MPVPRFGHGLVLAAALFLSAVAVTVDARAGSARHILLGATTTTDNSGLLDHLLPRFTEKSGIDVRAVIRGTGQVIKLAEHGDLDVLLVHHPESEERFVSEGRGVERHVVMYNDFVLVGPAADPAKAARADDIETAFRNIAASGSVFLSRGDDSGTNLREQEIWRSIAVRPGLSSGDWYRESGSGMGATLNTAAAIGAYALTDRASWITFRNKQDLALLHDGDPGMINVYGAILVNPAKHPHVKAKEGQAFIDWLLSNEGREAISSFRAEGKQLFHPWTGD